MMNHAEFANYIEQPVTVYRQKIFDVLIRQVSGGDVCDLGSHAVGHYWALGYAERADNICFYDLSEEAIALQQKAIDNLSPAMLEEYFIDTLDYIRESDIASGDPEHTALALQENISDIEPFDFLSSDVQRTFDWVLAFESLEVVPGINAFYKAFQTAHALLKPGEGTLLAIVIPAIEDNDYIKRLRKLNLGGLFKPQLEDIKAALGQARFSDYSIDIIPTYRKFYPDAYFITARH